MYPDPKRVRSNRLNVRLDTYEHSLLKALAEYQGVELSSMIRDLAVRQALADLTHEQTTQAATGTTDAGCRL
jgi:uncharacterized protein (DUF1778 family)